ncbi:hypothetical protein KO525_08090 [Psychrosphaera sp. B3R10]|nr:MULTISPECIES: hypothetical protein [unclassified Psychrosphaera]MBU2882650.1 hypothetical protein [Psychrosphaera sp. I2R16]MBU2989331.1 hypothetical protein [Psychrosphaera sp. B3R10]
MKFRSLYYLTTTLLLTLSGCSSDEKSTSDDTKEATNDVIMNASAYSKAELQAHVNSLIDIRYKGKTDTAALNLESVQRAYVSTFGDNGSSLPDFNVDSVAPRADANGNIDISFACNYGGSIAYSGKLSSDQTGNISMQFIDCKQDYYSPVLNGNVASEISNSIYEVAGFYFDNFRWSRDDESYSYTGYVFSSRIEQDNPYELTYTVSSKLLVSDSNNNQYIIEIESEINDQLDSFSHTYSGTLYDGEYGKTQFALLNNNETNVYRTISFEADKAIKIEFSYDHIKYLEDANNDNIYETGAYFGSNDELMYADLSEKTLAPIDLLSLPPIVNSPNVYDYWNLFTTSDIVAEQGYFSDPDTPESELTLSYRWYINGQVVENNTSNTLPAFTAIYGDSVEVSMVVSDGVNIIEGGRTSFEIQDSPAILQVSNLPNAAKTGDYLQFSAVVQDPDFKGSNGVAASLISAPEGATIDENGTVSWNVAGDMMFSSQEVDFVFGFVNEEANSQQFSQSITVTADKPLPIASASFDIPSTNKSMWVGDFSGDGNKRILTTNSRKSVYLLKSINGEFKHSWLYPYALPTAGNINQVIPVQYDDDVELEILVATEHGISLINGLTSHAIALLETEGYISSIDIADLNADGSLELIYLISDSNYSNSTKLIVAPLLTPHVTLFSTDALDSMDFSIANTDEDDQLEIVLSNGLVYDGKTYLNEWLSSNKFGSSIVSTGDYNGDGIDEIAGADSWGAIALYSAVNKSQLFSFDNFNTCSITTANIDDDMADELIIGDCQWGSITAYDFVNNALVKKWSVDMQEHGSKSIAVGDADNDGKLEVLWGSGQSSSGEDVLVIADIEDGIATVDNWTRTIQLDSYSSAGWASTDGNNDRAIFFIPETGSGYDGSRVLEMTDTGEFQLSEEISSNWDRSRYAIATDFNKDGIGDIFLPSTALYDGSFSALQLNDYSEIWSLNGDYDSDIGIIRAFDLNNDDYPDAVYMDGTSLKAIDIENQLFIANYTFNNGLNDFELDYKDTAYFYVSHGDKLSVMKLVDGALSEQSFITENCGRLEMINFDTDPELELACIVSTHYWNTEGKKIVIYDTDNSTLSEIKRIELPFVVLDMAVDLSTTSEQSLIITTQQGTDSSVWDDDNKYQIRKISHTGLLVWSSAALVGKPTPHGLKTRLKNDKLEIQLSTNDVMYWIK